MTGYRPNHYSRISCHHTLSCFGQYTNTSNSGDSSSRVRNTTIFNFGGGNNYSCCSSGGGFWSSFGNGLGMMFGNFIGNIFGGFGNIFGGFGNMFGGFGMPSFNFGNMFGGYGMPMFNGVNGMNNGTGWNNGTNTNTTTNTNNNEDKDQSKIEELNNSLADNELSKLSKENAKKLYKELQELIKKPLDEKNAISNKLSYEHLLEKLNENIKANYPELAQELGDEATAGAQAEQPEQPEQPGRTGQGEQPGQTGQTEQPGQTGQSGQVGQTGQTGQVGQSGQVGQGTTAQNDVESEIPDEADILKLTKSEIDELSKDEAIEYLKALGIEDGGKIKHVNKASVIRLIAKSGISVKVAKNTNSKTDSAWIEGPITLDKDFDENKPGGFKYTIKSIDSKYGNITWEVVRNENPNSFTLRPLNMDSNKKAEYKDENKNTVNYKDENGDHLTTDTDPILRKKPQN